MNDLFLLPQYSLMRSFFHQSHFQHVSIIGLLALAYQTRTMMSEPEKPLRKDITLAGWPPEYLLPVIEELDVNLSELSQYAQLGNDFWSSQLRLMPTFQRMIVMGLATLILTPAGAEMYPSRYTPWLGYWSKELNLDSLTMSQWMEAHGMKLIHYLLARGFVPSEF